MASARTAGHASAEEEALLNDTWLSAAEDDASVSVSVGSMKSRIKTQWLSQTLSGVTSENGQDLALEYRGDSRDLDDDQLRAQGHEVALQRSFSPLAAIGLGFRYFRLYKRPALD